MDDISKQVHEDNDAHTALHGPRRALERLRAMTWRAETLTYLIHIFPKSLSALNLTFADFPHRIKKIEIDVLRILQGWVTPPLPASEGSERDGSVCSSTSICSSSVSQQTKEGTIWESSQDVHTWARLSG